MLFWREHQTHMVYPRSIIGLRGILFALSARRVGSCAANTIPFPHLCWLIMLRDQRLLCCHCNNAHQWAWVWLIASPYTVHIGASGLILAIWPYCYAATLNAAQQFYFSLIVGLLYGSLILGVLPLQGNFLARAFIWLPGVHWLPVFSAAKEKFAVQIQTILLYKSLTLTPDP